MSEGEGKKRYRKRIQFSDASLSARDFQPSDAKAPVTTATITVSLKKIPVCEACKFIAGLSDYSMHQRITDDSVVFLPNLGNGTVEPLVTRSVRLRFDLLSDLKETNQEMDVRSWLESTGMVFYERTSVDYDSRTRTLTIVNTENQLEGLDMLFVDGLLPTFSDQVRFWIEWPFSFLTPAPSASSNYSPAVLPPNAPTDSDAPEPATATPGL